jgi:hypothetical protein
VPIASATLFMAFLLLLFYAIPALSIHLMVWGLADPRREAWEVTEGAHAWKQRYRQGAFFAQYLNLFLLALFLLHTLASFLVERFGCDIHANHTTAAAWNLIRTTEVVWIIGYVVLAIGAALAVAWAIGYYVTARKHNWADPRRRDGLIVHIFIVPLAVLLLLVAYGSMLQTFCPELSP